ncbi:splicing factor 3B subunit 2 isoform X1, partial [Lates japonicus]
MASDGPPGTESLPSDLGSAIAGLNTWSNPELQAKLAELGAPTMGPREELIDRLKGYMMQTGILLSKPNDDKSMGSQMQGIPPMPPMPMPPMPPGIGMLQAMSMMPGGPPSTWHTHGHGAP